MHFDFLLQVFIYTSLFIDYLQVSSSNIIPLFILYYLIIIKEITIFTVIISQYIDTNYQIETYFYKKKRSHLRPNQQAKNIAAKHKRKNKANILKHSLQSEINMN